MVTPLMIQTADILNTIIISNSFLFVNLWSLIHIIFGAIVMRYIKDKSFYKLFGLLVLYEIFEFTVIALGYDLFRPELWIDMIYDLIFGLVGGWLYIKFRNI